MPSRYDASTKAKAIRLVREHRGGYPRGSAKSSGVTRVACR
jgi:hypothetical protein